MSILHYYYTNILKRDLLTKFVYKNVLEIPSLNKIVLHMSTSQATLRNLLPSLAALLLISSHKPSLLLAKPTKLRLKIKGGVVIGCKVDLRGKDMFLFLEKLIFYVIPRLKAFRYIITEKNLFFKIDNLFLFKEIEKEYEYFQDLPVMMISLKFNVENPLEISYFLSALKFPLFQND